MKLVPLLSLFDIKYGVNLELNGLTLDPNGTNFVSRTSENNGISARVKPIPNIKPIGPGTITVSAGGSVMEAFVQPEPFYSGRDLYFLRPISAMTLQVKLYYCLCIRANKHKYSFGRQANRTLKDLLVPALKDIPSWVKKAALPDYSKLSKAKNISKALVLDVKQWKAFRLGCLFEIKKGKRLTKRNMKIGATPYIGAVEFDNGVTAFIGQKPIHQGNTITVSYNGSVAEAFYQPKPFWATDDVNVLYPKFALNGYRAMFLITLIRREKHRFNFGRKWRLERMNNSVILLPVTDKKLPDWDFMERYVKCLSYSKVI